MSAKLPRVLIVEDDPVVAKVVEQSIKRLPAVVRLAGTLAEARAAYSEALPNLVLLDLNLPDGVGFEFCRFAAPNVPVIIMTVRGAVDDRIEGFRCGARDYVLKPFSVEELCMRAGVHLGDAAGRRNLTEAAREALLRERARQDLVDMVVHDLKVPLASIKGTIELLRDLNAVPDPRLASLLDNSARAGEQMLVMLNDFLDVSLGDRDALPVHKEDVETAALLRRLEELFAPEVQRGRLRLEASVAPAQMRLRTDPTLLYRILFNLVSNAAKFAPTGSPVLLQAKGGAGRAVFTVSDSGPGLSEEDKPRVFGRDFAPAGLRVSRTKAGTGVGLFFCALACRALGGTIGVSDRPGGGAVFTVDLPSV
ncbi:hybrid sensor histidine kinase/response regulator [bacterium]|nr:MAG: hybrid sensor histidine kinase/response regulator [bacterium]